jgi:hypothetical protein
MTVGLIFIGDGVVMFIGDGILTLLRPSPGLTTMTSLEVHNAPATALCDELSLPHFRSIFTMPTAMSSSSQLVRSLKIAISKCCQLLLQARAWY